MKNLTFFLGSYAWLGRRPLYVLPSDLPVPCRDAVPGGECHDGGERGGGFPQVRQVHPGQDRNRWAAF